MSRLGDALVEAARHLADDAEWLCAMRGVPDAERFADLRHVAWLAYDLAALAYKSAVPGLTNDWRREVIERCNAVVTCYADAIGIPPIVG